MKGGAVGPYLSALLVAHEIASAAALFGRQQPVHLVADGVLAESYSAAFEAAGLPIAITTPEAAFIAGVTRLAAGLAS
jgi:2-dehydro-3-deoxygalactonokinase